MNEKTTTIALYVSDRDWLQARQLQASAKSPPWKTMPEIIRALIGDIDTAEREAAEIVQAVISAGEEEGALCTDSSP